MEDTPIIPASEVKLSDILAGVQVQKVARGRKYPVDRRTGEKFYYLDLVTAFDIETSKEHYGPEKKDWRSWMYIWQWQIGEVCTIIGRTWDEFIALVNEASRILPDNVRLMVYVHNLAFEFEFLAGIWNFGPGDVFATDVHAPLYALMGKLEFRCSYRLSNYSLDKWAKECRSDHQKLVGNLDYSMQRFPWTPLTEEELAYCVHDVIVVVECVEIMLKTENDNLYSIPYTSTGYIRRRVRAAMRMWSPTAVPAICGDIETYDRLRSVFRGGNTHANRWYVDQLLGDVISYDRSSSYPDVIVHCKFPMTKFREEEPTFERLKKLIEGGRAVMMKISFINIRLADDQSGIPYLPLDTDAIRKTKTVRKSIGAEEDNGRLLSAAFYEIAVTDIDYDIICDQYVWDYCEIHWMMSSRYGYLPQPLTDILIDLYKKKTLLKGIEEDVVVYNHTKAQLNSAYGMMVQRMISNGIEFVNNKWIIPPEFDRNAEYAKAVERAFLAYQWGVWTAAWARFRLQEGVTIAEQHHPNGLRSSFRLRRYRLCQGHRPVGLLQIQCGTYQRRKEERRIRSRFQRRDALYGSV